MKGIIALAGTAAMTLAGILSTTAAASVPAASAGAAHLVASASAGPVVYGVPLGHLGSNYVHGKVRPTGPLVASGDGSLGFTIHSWSTWSGSGAWGSATEHVRTCWGSCHRFAAVHTTLHFYRVRYHNGHAYFTRLHSHPKHKVPYTSTLKFYSQGLVAW
jgi:hypothetical protein